MDPGRLFVLVTLEGIDGTGKSTLHKALAKSLEDFHPIFTREPSETWLGEAVRRAIAEQKNPIVEALLFVADHAEHINSIIRPALAEGKLVISDRYTDSRYAYQSVTLDGVIPKPLEWLQSLHNGWTIVPDRTFLLAMPIDEALERLKVKTGREHFERKEVLEKVQRNYLELAQADPSRFVIIDATKEKEEIVQFVSGAIRQSFQSSRSRRRR
jgi:dTMP kinase